MAMFPKIQSPCPYKDRLSSVMEGDFCRMCKRDVVDLTDMSDAQRLAFLNSCTGEVCVSYSLPAHVALAAALVVASVGAPLAASACPPPGEIVVVAGGIRHPAKAEHVAVQLDSRAAELPVVYEDAATNKPAKPSAATTKTGAPAPIIHRAAS